MANTIKIDVLADVKNINKGIGDVNSKLDSFGKGAAKVGSALKGAFAAGAAAVIGGGIVEGIKGAITAASDMNETVSKTQTIFGKASPSIIAFGDNAAKSMGISKQQALEGASAFGNFFDQIGLSKAASADMSKGLVTMSSDLASFNNADPAKVMEALQGATRGEYDSLQQFIPTVNAAAVQTEALAETHKKSAKTLTDAEKATALYTLAQKGMGKAQGDFARTSGGLANQQRILSARFKDIQANIGAKLLPIVLKAVTLFGSKLGPVMDKVGGIAGKLGNVFTTQVLPKIKQFGQFIIKNAVPAAQNLLSVVKPLGQDALKTIVSAFQSLLPKVKDFGGFLKGTVVPAVVSFTGFLKDNGTAVRAIAVGIGAAVLAFKAYQLGMALAGGIAKTFTAVQAALNVVMALNPIGIVVLALVALAAGLIYAYKKSETFRNIVNGAFDAVKTGVVGVINFFKNLPGNISKAVGSLASLLKRKGIDLITGFVGGYVAGFVAVGKFFKGLAVKVAGFVGNLAKTLFRKGVDLINGIAGGYNSAIGAVANFFRGIAGKVLGWIGNTASTLARKGRDFVAGLANGAAGNVKAVTGFFSGLPGKALNALGSVGSKLYNAGADLLRGMINGVKSMAGNLISSVTGPIGDAIGKAKGLLGIHSPSTVFKDIGVQTVAGLVIGLKTLSGIKTAASGMARAVADGFTAPALSIDGNAGAGDGAGTIHIHMDGTFVGTSKAEFTKWVQDALATGQKYVRPRLVITS